MAGTPGGRRPTSRRPKRLAGHARPADPVEPPVVPPEPDPEPSPRRPSSSSRRPADDADETTAPDPVPAPAPTPGRPSSSSRRPAEDADETTTDETETDETETGVEPAADEPARRRRPLALLVLAVLLLAVVVAEAVYVLTEPESPETVSAERPVVLDPLETQGVVDQAAADVVTIVSGGSSTFDDDLDRATALMTSDFADSYRDTKEDVRERWVAEQVQVTAQVSAQGVVRADADQVEALLFLTQATTKGDGGPTLVQYRVLATMVDTDDGWLVSKLQTF